ncbi:hypothetical protein LshimejAT787_0202200 [Lyophyllum shimeji]|uniref:F-box domain-containing protein n=1 Tax=Lyophyllum shimeji TaxID=47721 RepID=A0A9P3PES5_LYOSH|nr:hypothetical protein LshimejAT787_0202200 [Lyophyllum shimeji]
MKAYPPTFDQLPLDILTLVQSFVEPIDIISLRKTCRHLSHVTHQRNVWIDALRRVCTSHGLFLPSFALAQMPRKALEFAALAPRRFCSMIKKATIDTIPPHSTFVLESRLASLINESQAFYDYYLIPGGRYLITHNYGGIILWDLGINLGEMATPVILGSLRGDGHSEIFEVRPSVDGSGIVLFVGTHDDEEYTTAISVYTIFPLVPRPSFLLKASVNGFNVVLNAHSANDTMFAFMHSADELTIWNFEINSIVTWAYQDPNVSDFMILQEHVILFTARKFSLYNIPTLLPCDLGNALTSHVMRGDHYPLMVFAHASDAEYMDVTVPWSSWNTDWNDRPFFGITASTGQETGIIDYYMTEELRSANLPTRMPFLADSIVLRRSQHLRSGVSPSLRFCDRYVIHSWLETEVGVFLIMSGLPTTTLAAHARGRSGMGHVAKLWAPSGAEDSEEPQYIRHFALCPASGRLCVSTNCQEIHIIDFLAPC